MIHYIIIFTLLFSSLLGLGLDSPDEHYPGEQCFIVWPSWESERYCDSGLYTIQFCYLPADPGNREFHHYHPSCSSGIVPPVIYPSRIYLPIVYNTKSYDSTYLKCTYDIDDSWGITAGTVTSWFLVEYHPDGPVRLKEFFDRYEPDPSYKMVYDKWYGTPANSLFTVNHLRTYAPNTNWNSTYAESISVWEAVTYLGASKTYTLNSVAFRKGHYRYPIDCIKVP